MKSHRKILFYLLLAGVLLRIIHFYFFAGGPYYGNNVFDARNYYEDAIKITKGDWLGGRDAFFRAPLYTYWLALLFKCFGPESPMPIVLQWIFGVAGSALLYPLTRRLTRGLPGSQAASLLAVGFGLFYVLQVHYETQLLDISLQSLFSPLIVLTGIKAYQNRRGRDFALFGFIGALSCLARPAALPFFGLITLATPWLLKPAPGARAGGARTPLFAWARLKGSIGPVIALWLGLTPPIAVVAARNYYVSHDFVPIATYAGVNLWIGNNHESDGIVIQFDDPLRYQGYFYKDAVQFFSEIKSKAETGKTMTAGQIQSFWMKKTLRDIAAHPGTFLSLLFKKFVAFWNGYEISNNKDIYVVCEYNPVLRALLWVFNFRLFGPLALWGAFEWLRLRRPGRNGMIYLLFLFTLVAGVVGFFINMRYRYPAVTMMLPMAGFGLTRLAALAREWPRLTWNARNRAMAAVCGAALFVNLPFFDLKHVINPWIHYWSTANNFRMQGRMEEAIPIYKRVMLMAPEKLSPRNNLGEIYYEQSREARAKGDEKTAALYRAEALKLFENIMRTADSRKWINPKGYLVHKCLALNNMGVVYEEGGNLAEAEKYYRQAVTEDPNYLKSWINLADLSARRGDWQTARVQWQKGVGSQTDPLPDALLGLARYYDHVKDAAQARAHVMRAVEIDAAATGGYIKDHPELQPYAPPQMPPRPGPESSPGQ